MRFENEKDTFAAIDSLDAKTLEKELQDIDYKAKKFKSGTLKRIKANVRKKENMKKVLSPRFKIGMRAAAIALTLAVAGTVYVGPMKVMGAISGAIQYIPGGSMFFPKDTVGYVLESPVKITSGEHDYEIKTAFLKDNYIYLAVASNNMNGISSSYNLYDSNMKKCEGNPYMCSSRENAVYLSCRFKPETNNYKNMQLIIDNNIKLPFSLAQAGTYQTADAVGPTSSKNGINITAVYSKTDNLLKVNCITDFKNDQQDIPFDALWNLPSIYINSKFLSLSDNDYNEYQQIDNNNLMLNENEFVFDLKENAKKNYHLLINQIEYSKVEKNDVQINVPDTGEEIVNKTVNIAGYPVTLQSVKRINEKYALVYFDTHYKSSDQNYLNSFTLYEKNEPFSCSTATYESGINVADEVADRHIKVINLWLKRPGAKPDVCVITEASGTSRHVTAALLPIKQSGPLDLTIESPTISQKGPWTFDLNLK